MTGCPHGDPYCPCPDGLLCHYEGADPMPCPNHPGTHKRTTSAARVATIDPDTGDPTSPWTDIGAVTITVRGTGPHCHIEGCTWTGGLEPGTCGIARIAGDTPLSAAHGLGCGAVRALVAGTEPAPT